MHTARRQYAVGDYTNHLRTPLVPHSTRLSHQAFYERGEPTLGGLFPLIRFYAHEPSPLACLPAPFQHLILAVLLGFSECFSAWRSRHLHHRQWQIERLFGPATVLSDPPQRFGEGMARMRLIQNDQRVISRKPSSDRSSIIARAVGAKK